MQDDDSGQAFTAIYYGRTISSAKLIGVTTDPATVAAVARRIIAESRAGTPRSNAVTSHLERGRRAALQQIIRDAEFDDQPPDPR